MRLNFRNYSLCFIFFSSTLATLVSSLIFADPKSLDMDQQIVKERKKSILGNLYGRLQMRYHLSTYYDKDDYVDKQEVAAHVRMRFGSTFYRGKLDLFGSVGFLKLPKTRKVIQRRPEIELDYYPFFGRWGQIALYNIVELPLLC